jgi:hypothetical protein
MFVVEIIALIYIPLRIARALFLALIGPIEWIIGLFRSGSGIVAGFGRAFAQLEAYIAPVLEPLSVLGSTIAKFFAGIAAGVAATGVFKFFAGLRDLFSQDTTSSAERYNKKLEEINKKLNGNVQASDKATKATGGMSAAQLEFNKSFEDSIRMREYELKLRTGTQYYSDAELKVQLELQKLRLDAAQRGAKIAQDQIDRVRSVIMENDALEKQIKLRQDIIAAGTETVTRISRAADPRIAAETEYQNAKIALENYFVENSMFTQEQYYATLKQLEDQYRLEKFNAELALIDQISKYREMDLYKQIQQQKDLLGNQRYGSEQAKQMASERVAFEKKSESEKAAWAIEQTASVFDSLGKYNKRAFEMAKAFNIANAIMNTYMGATKALATYPPPFNFIGAAAVVASGLAQVATIRSQQYSGRAIGGPVAGGTPYIVGENGPEMFVPQGAGKVVPNNQLDGQPVNVTFNINTVDARGMDQLLMERKGMIVGMVRSAINDRGVKAPM